MINIKVNKKLVSIFLLFALVLVATAAVSATDSDQTTAVSDDSSLDTSSSDTVATSDSSASTTSSSAATTDNSATSSSSSSSGDVKTTASSDTTTQKADTSSSTNVKESSSSSQASTTTSAADTNTVSTKSVDTHTVSSDSSSKTLSTEDEPIEKTVYSYSNLASEVTDISENGQADTEYVIDLSTTGSDTYTVESHPISWENSEVTSLTINGNYVTFDASNFEGSVITVAEDCTLILNDMTITGASVVDGAIYTQGTLILNNVNFVDNTATDRGAAIYILGGEVTIDSSAFTGNVASTSGGAIYNNGGTLTVTNSEFTENTAHNNGGAIHNTGSGVLTVSDSKFTENTAGDAGGAIDNYGSSALYIDTCEFNGNTAKIGGAINNQGTLVISKSDETSEDTTTFTDNEAENGGAINVNSSTATIEDATFTSNTATVSGGAIYVLSGTVSISASEFSDNEATNEDGTASAGAIYSVVSLTISDSTFEDNTADDYYTIYAQAGSVGTGNTITADAVGFIILIEDTEKVLVTSPLVDMSLADDTTVTFRYSSDDEHSFDIEIEGTIENGIATATLPIEATGNYIIAIDYPTDSDYYYDLIYVNLEATKTVLTVDEIPASEKVGSTIEVTGTLTNDGEPLVDEPIIVTVTNDTGYKDTFNGTVDEYGSYSVMVTLPETAGTYSVTVSYLGNDKQSDAESDPQSIELEKLATQITITTYPEEISLGDSVIVVVSLEDENGNPIDDEITYNTETVENGEITYNTETVETVGGLYTTTMKIDKKAEYTIDVSYDGNDDTYEGTEESYSFTVEGIAAEIVLDDTQMSVLPNTEFEVTGTIVTEGTLDGAKVQLELGTPDKYGNIEYKSYGEAVDVDEFGTFEILVEDGLGEGSYLFRVVLDSKVLEADPTTLNVAAGLIYPELTVEDVTDYTTDPQITITGTVFDGETPLSGTVYLLDENNQVIGTETVDDEGTFTFEIDNVGTEKLTVRFEPDEELKGTYAEISQDVTVTVLKVTTTIENVDVPAGVPTEETTITGTLVAENGDVMAEQEINIFVDDVLVGTGKTDEFGNFAVTIDPLDEGTHNLVIEYPGNENYLTATEYETLTVAKLDAKLTVTADDVLFTEETIISGTLMDGETPIEGAEVYVTIGDEIVGTVTTDEFGYYEIAYTATTTGEFTVVAQYAGSDKYNAAEATATFTVSTVETQITVPDVSGKVNETVDLTAIVTDTEGNPITTGDVIFKINGKTLKDEDGNTITVAVDENGFATLPYVLDHTPKDYVLTASYIGDEIYERADSDNATITVKKVKADTITTVSDVIGTINSTVDLTATVVDEYGDPVTSGEVSFKLNGVTIKDEEGNTLTAPVVDGVATLPYVLDHSAKTYNITAVYAGDSDYASSRDESGVLTVEKGVLDTTIIVSDVTGKQGETVDLVATIVDENGNVVLDGSVVFKLNGVTIKDEDGNAILVDVVDGVATLPYELVNSAKDYTISATYSGSEYYTSSRTEEDATLTVLDPLAAVVTPVDVSGKMGETVDLTATVTDVDGNAVNSGKVAFKLNGVTLKDENGDVIYADVEDGIATLPYEIVNSPKDYTITALYYSDDQSIIKNAKSEDDAVLTVEKEDITATLDDITITQGENANIAFTIYDENGDQVTKDTKVVVKANGKTQVSTTVVNGEANIELPSSTFKNPTYDITVVIGENSYYNGLTLEATLYVE